ncbi:MAG: hypothetical protein ACKPE6_07805 [Gammaproteobacteria bacterium]
MAFRFAPLALLALLGTNPAASQHMRPDDVDKLPSSAPVLLEAYGTEAA